MITIKPKYIYIDTERRLHCSTGPCVEFDPCEELPNGLKLYAIHNVRIPSEKSWIIEDKSRITVYTIDAETNSEIRRIMIEFFGFQNYVLQGGYEAVDEDLDQYNRPRRLLKCMKYEEETLLLEVTNSSPEASYNDDLEKVFVEKVMGVTRYYKKYYLNVDTQLRPLPQIPKDLDSGRARDVLKEFENTKGQKLTCHNAAASLCGMYGYEYNPIIET